MKIKTLFLAIAALMAVAAPKPGYGQELGYSLADRLAAWFSPYDNGGPFSVAQTGYTDPCNAEDLYCQDGRCGDCNGCCPGGDFFVSAELLVWWAKGSSLPPLVTTAPPNTPLNPLAQPASLGQPGTRILFGDELAGDEAQLGTRLTAGVYLDHEHNTAVGGRFFILGGDSDQYSAASSGSPILARPFFNELLQQQDALLVAYPGNTSGEIRARLAQQNTLGFEGFLEFMMSRDCNRRIDLIGGYQFFRLDDYLQIDSSSDTILIPGLHIDITDRFSTQNEFHGAMAGLKGRWARGCWALDGIAKAAVGSMRQQVTIAGQTTTSVLGVAGSPDPIGLLAQPSNSGVYERNKFAFIPELTLNLRYYATRNLSLHLGYNIMWISDIALSGQQIDFGVDPSQTVQPPRPRFVFNDQDYWLQGINLGVNWNY